jgi:peptidoglycan/xylan/chitin deacetylase (PgdA/CDA1 family)
MSKTVKTPKAGVKKPPPKDQSKSQRAKTSKSRKPGGLRALLTGRTGIMLIGATLIFCVLMTVATIPTVAFLLEQYSDGDEEGPTLIAAPFVEAIIATQVPPEPVEEEPEGTGDEVAEVASLPLQPDIQPTPDGVFREGRVPILMYHYVSTPPEDADVYRLDLSVTPEQFEDQMAWLDENGYTTISPYEMMDWLATGAELPDKPVMLTFDDGYVDNYENAFPVLQEYGQTATFFILTGATEAENPEYMSWDMLREMAEGGMHIEMHAHDHLNLDNRDAGYLALQIDASADIMAERLGYRPRFLAYPGGDYDDRTIEALQEYGYWLGLTTVHGCLHYTGNEFELQRIRVRGEYNLETYAWFIESAFSDEEFCYGYG